MSTQPPQSPQQRAYLALMRGLKEVDLRGSPVPCNLILTGDHAFPLVMNNRGQILMAASQYGSGRIVVMGHEAYMSKCADLVENALTWLRGDESNNLSVGVHSSAKAVADGLTGSGFQSKIMGSFQKNMDVGVYVTNAYSLGSDVQDLVAFLRNGGGVLIGGQAWHWASSHQKENTLLHFGGNKISAVAGIYFTEHPAEAECVPVYPQIPSSWKGVVIGKDFEEDLEFLLQGISEFNTGNAITSEIVVHGQLAFPIAMTEDGTPFIAASYYGLGRVMVVSHESLLGREELAPFWKNVVHWLDQDRRGTVGVLKDHAFNLFKTFGFECSMTDFHNDLSVFVGSVYTDKYAKEMHNFVAEGGGLLLGGHAWYWVQQHKGQNPLTEFAGNKILNRMGLSLLGSYVRGEVFKAPVPSQSVKDAYHFRHLLQRFAAHVTQGQDLTKNEEQYYKRFGKDCATFLKMNGHDRYSYAHVLSTLIHVIKKSGMPQISESRPVTSPKDHLLLNVGQELYKVCPNPDNLLPYLIKEIPPLAVVYNHRVPLNVNTAEKEEWISTGLYLSPGMRTYLAIPAQLVNTEWKVQIGCQTDFLKSEELKRAPTVCEEFPITAEIMQVWNLWGGLIYLVAPPQTQLGGIEVIVQVAVPAPYYKSGVTTAADWSVLRTAPSPWAELEFENIVLTLPSDVVRNVDQPDLLATFWDSIMRSVADLAATPPKFSRKERFVADVQISHGWMHAGYPIMMYQAAADNVVNMEKAKTAGLWGPIHELGHNQQRACWEFRPHTTECTCNIWSVYVHEEVFGIDRTKAHGALTPEDRKSRLEKFVKEGKPLKSWEVWLALETYLQLQEKFGWDAFKSVFAAYHTIKDYPKDNDGKMNLYAETFSQAVEMNLCGFFKAWSWPIDTGTEEKLSKLPPWTDHPMVQYD
uniref:TRPM8 channel-associated factor homolog n=1 Tax=Doryrhamphus excisus TaxID=161450 RepID=UPI0025AE7718|nr:TRPM8 channel-associated factor homolog [Doryrhamphus excisus]XP_057936544.1 TRPM8 channel-associated factor homolog [Doryrhamphus excisus]XP_057936545.1 TRPM8 channel-associated factor homolog [Doryrhamphus excisus]XP_057936546.1 TRPM8 channel-associated factor homolog [Doryrhamphus excisus]XP_057936547.1 TRPM8 channel-associated factor homolog [Doryrhamphus excisus]XP_057936549.1 TRPM8 channel-associated factor homolog [Doryrhamphus excisus]XP_057936550.1 TRPM8 channel-associated factor 